MGYYKIGKSTSIKLGWAHLSLNYTDYIRSEKLNMKVSLSGPSIGVAFVF